jgi:tRNA G18 (ribose-2'-O)-methylase SpoU
VAVRVAALVGVTTILAEMEQVAKALPEALRCSMEQVVTARLVVVEEPPQQVVTV